jgi:hypothetical protein
MRKMVVVLAVLVTVEVVLIGWGRMSAPSWYVASSGNPPHAQIN